MSYTEEQKREHASIIIEKFTYGPSGNEEQLLMARVLSHILPLATKEQMQEIVEITSEEDEIIRDVSCHLIKGFSRCRVAWAASFVQQLVIQSGSEDVADAGIDALLFMWRYRAKESGAAIEAIIESELYDFTHEVDRVHRVRPFVFIDVLLDRVEKTRFSAKREIYLKVLCRLAWANDSVFLSHVKPMIDELIQNGEEWKATELIAYMCEEGVGQPCETASKFMVDTLKGIDFNGLITTTQSSIMARIVMYSDEAVTMMENNTLSCSLAMYLLSVNIKKRKHFSTRLYDIKRICMKAISSNEPELVDVGLTLAYQLDLKDNAELEVICRNRALDSEDEGYTDYLELMSINGFSDSLCSVSDEVPESLTGYYMGLLAEAYDKHEFLHGHLSS